MSLDAIGENDWHFDHFHSLSPDFVGQLDLEAVAVGLNGVDLQRFQCAPAKAFVPAGGITEGHAGDDADIFSGIDAQHEPSQRPVDDANAIDVSRTQNKIGIFGGLQEDRNIIRVMGEVAVHLENEFIPALQSPFKSRDVSAPKTVFFQAMQNVNGRMLRREFIRQPASAIG